MNECIKEGLNKQVKIVHMAQFVSNWQRNIIEGDSNHLHLQAYAPWHIGLVKFIR